MTPKSDISVVICAYTEERWDLLLKAIESIKVQTLLPLEIIVVIDHNTILLDRLKAALSDLIVIENTQTQGLSGARNCGIEKSRGVKVAFLDDDAVADPMWLETFAPHFDSPTILGVGSRVAPRWESMRPSWFPMEFGWVVGCSYIGLPETASEIRNPFGGAMCIRKQVFDLVGGFRTGQGRTETVPLGCEETDLCIRARQQYPGDTFFFDPEAVISHHVPDKRATWKYFISRCYYEGISKAQLSRFVGAKDGLQSERTYTFQVLPRGVIRHIGDTFLKGDLSGIARAGVIVLGLFVTSAGYVVDSLCSQLVSRQV